MKLRLAVYGGNQCILRGEEDGDFLEDSEKLDG